jgi:3-oxoacyl-[acyl-carrier-protein] synthase II
MRRRIAITGMGVISSLGTSSDDFHSALCEQRNGVGSTEYAANGLEAHQNGNLTPLRPELYLQGRMLRPLDRTGRLVAGAAKLVLESSGWTNELLAKHEVGLALGTMFSSMHTIGQFDRHALAEGPSCASPLDFANTVINSAAGQTAIWHKLRGINSTICTGSTSGLMALGYAADLIAYGNQTAILVGGADELCFESFCGLQRAGLLRNSDNQEDSSVPFDSRRNGFALAEASALLMLEEWESATAREALILGEIRGHANAYNPHYRKQHHGPDAIVRCMRAAIDDAQSFPSEIDCISASANGSRLADKDEAFAIEAVFNHRGHQIPITAIKSMVGESLGASGILQAIDLIETIRSGQLPGILNLESPDPELPALNFCRQTQNLRVRSGVINSIGFDGHACSLVVSAPQVNNKIHAVR